MTIGRLDAADLHVVDVSRNLSSAGAVPPVLVITALEHGRERHPGIEILRLERMVPVLQAVELLNAGRPCILPCRSRGTLPVQQREGTGGTGAL